MNKNSQRSLYNILGVIVTSVVVTVMSVLLAYNYYYTKNEIIDELNDDAKITLLRLKNSIAPFIESYSVNEYEELIVNEMGNNNIFAIVVDDYLSGQILGDKVLHNGKIRDSKGNIEIYKNDSQLHISSLKKTYLSLNAEILSHGKYPIGKINIYYTDRYMNEELNILIQKSIFITITVSLLLIFSLFIAIKKNILNPIEKIVQTLLEKGEDGLPLKAIPSKGSKEIQDLATIMNEIIDTTRSSKQKLRELNERFELTLDAVQDGIWDWNLTTDKTYYSKRWKGMLGYDEEDIKNEGRVFFNLLYKDDKKKVKKAIKKHFENPEKHEYNIEIRLKCKDGNYKWILSRGKVMFDADNEPVRMLGYHSDITEKKINEEYQEQQDKIIIEQSRLASMGEMIGNIAHQWRQPLSVISTGVTGMKLEKEFDTLSDEFFYETCDIINENAQYLSKTIDDFRDFIKGNKKKSLFNLSNTIHSLLRILKGTIQNHNIVIHLDLDDNIYINGYENQLLQCFINIINNSKDALNDKTDKLIFIKSSKEGENAIVSFKDSAGGIPEDIMPHIFEPYFTTKHQSQGTGLGLNMTHNLIVKGMDGQIFVSNVEYEYNSKIYIGAEFKIVLLEDNK